MNQRLSELYSREKSTLYEVKARCSVGMHGPFLIAPNEAYWRSEIKVAFVGQETRGWASAPDIQSQMVDYSEFDLGKNYYASPFWNVIRKLEKALTGTSHSSAWLNLNRYDQDKKRPTESNRQVLAELDFLLLEELRILAPDMVIFLTGPNYDLRINRLLQATQLPIKGLDPRQLCRVESSVLNSKIVRTYHPNYLPRSGVEKSIIAAIGAELAPHTQG